MKFSRTIIVTIILSLLVSLTPGTWVALASNVVKSDKQRPNAPTQLVSTGQTTTSISLSWAAAVDNVGIERYFIYRNAIKIGEVSASLTYIDTGLMPNSTYRYSVKAIDLGRNISPSSRSMTVRTKATAKGNASLLVLEPKIGMRYNNVINVRTEAYSPNITAIDVYYSTDTKPYPSTPNATQTMTRASNQYFFSLDLTNQPDTTAGKVKIVAKLRNGTTITREVRNLAKTNTGSAVPSLKDGSTILKNSSGATLGTRFVVWSKHATKMQVWLYGQNNPTDGQAIKVMDLIKQPKTTLGGFNWTVDALNDPGITYGAGMHYGLRVWGPNFEYHQQWRPGTEFGLKSDVDAAGNRFNPNKVLNDPYSRALSHDPEMLDTKYYTGAGYRHIDTSAIAPKSVVYDTSSYTKPDSRRGIPWEDTIFYEVHPKGYTANPNSGVANPGTYKGFTQKLDHLKELGVTSIEFLPIHESANEGRDSNGGNYWSYMTVNYFTPDRKYSSDKTPIGAVHEFKDMVKAIHDNGMEVILDVVYNHSGEGGLVPNMGITNAPMINFRGIDNISYYSLKSSSPNSTALDSYYDMTGCTSTFNVVNPKGRQFILDSLRYWVDEMKIDGFRYDLASVLGNTIEHGSFKYDKNGLLTQILQEFPNTKHIAEPWAAGGDGSYQVGNYPRIPGGSLGAGWAEWQDRFRDTVRRVVRAEGGLIPDLATRIAGSADLYQDDGRKPYHSVNKVTSHDGFTMNDLVSYNVKLNLQDPPYGPSDGGSNNNYSWDSDGNEELRRQQIRNFTVHNLLSIGTPLILGGDEFRRTQFGNNNAYNLDTIANWYDWELKNTHKKIYDFYRGLVKLRKTYPVFKRTEFFTDRDNDNDGIRDLQWHGVNYRQPDWTEGSRALAWRFDGARQETGASSDANNNDFFIIANHYWDKLNFQLPPNNPGKKWYLVADTSAWWGDNQASLDVLVNNPGQQVITDGSWTNTWATTFQGNSTYGYGANARSMAIFIEK